MTEEKWSYECMCCGRNRSIEAGKERPLCPQCQREMIPVTVGTWRPVRLRPQKQVKSLPGQMGLF